MIHNLSSSVQSLEELPMVLTVPEVGVALRIGLNSSYQLIRAGKIRSLKIGRQLRVPREALIEYMNQTKN